jgi:molybdopterin molybdotransferase
METLPTTEARGRYLAETATSRVANPAFDNAAMDGYALRAADVAEGGGELPVAATVPAGDNPEALPSGACARIMTGAPIPPGADTVVMQEHVTARGELARFAERPPAGSHIRRAGEDMTPGDPLAEPGELITPALLSALVTAGVAEVRVRRRPRALVLSTGSELRPLGEPLGPGQIYDSNRPALVAALEELGCVVTDGGGVTDELAELREAFRQAAEYDLVVTSGGVSVGEFDQVRQVLEEQGEIGLWKVAIKPGKPFAFGRLGKAHLFGMPGNPVSALVTFRQFVAPAVARWMGGSWLPPRAVAEAGSAYQRKGAERTEFLPATLEFRQGRLLATPHVQPGSGKIAGFAGADALILLDAGNHGFDTGESVTVEPLAAGWC